MFELPRALAYAGGTLRGAGRAQSAPTEAAVNDFFREMNRNLDRFLTPAVKTILLANVGIFLGTMVLSIFQRNFAVFTWSWLGSMPGRPLELWRYVTYLFVHGDVFHLFFNMLVLWFFAPPLENRWGTRGFWTFYLVVGALAALGHMACAHIPNAPVALNVIGASGAIYGVFVAFAAYYPNTQVYLFGVFPIKAAHLVILLVLMDFLSTQSASMSGGNVSYITHLMGALAGYLYLAAYHKDPDIRRWRWR